MKAFNKDKELRKLKFKQNKNTYIKRVSIVLSCVILVVAIMMFSFAYYNSNVEWTLIEGNVNYEINTTIDKVYLGSTETNVVPQKENGWDFVRAECTNGATATWDNNNWQLNTTYQGKRTKCTLYFKEHFVLRGTASNIISSLSSYNTTSDVFDMGYNSIFAYDGTTDNNLRYVGTNPNNYVQFNNELWRIIGVMNNIETQGGQTQSLVKIIRNDSLGNYSWDTSERSSNSGAGINEWSQADLMQELNNDYLGNITVGTDGNWYSEINNAKLKAKPTTTISSTSQSMIESVKWKLGSPSNNAGSYDSNWQRVSASTSYTRERSNYTGKICTSGTACNDTVTRTSTWTGKVGLFYPSDYLYATSGGSTTNRTTCIGLGMYTDWGNTSYANCKGNDWLKPASGATWTLSPLARSSNAAFVSYVDLSGYVSELNASYPYGVRPVVFLKSSTVITGGQGTQSNPYKLG